MINTSPKGVFLFFMPKGEQISAAKWKDIGGALQTNSVIPDQPAIPGAPASMRPSRATEADRMPSTFFVADAPTGFARNGSDLFVPERYAQSPVEPKEDPPINFAERAAERPANYDSYLVETETGEKRFDFEGARHKAVLEYIHGPEGKSEEGAYERFKVHTDAKLERLKEPYGVATIEEVREKMMEPNDLVPLIGGELVVPYNYHQPNLGHYEGDFFCWDNLWSVTWATMRDEPQFAQGVLNNLRSEFNVLGYEPNSNQVKIMNRSQPFVSPIMYVEIAKALPENEDTEAWRQDTVSYLKSVYFNAWVDDPEGEARFNTYEDYTKGHSAVWKNQAITPTGLPRYSGADVPGDHYAAESASGEDCTPRFRGRAADYNPTDLAGFIGIAQKVFYNEAKRLGNEEEAAHWEREWDKTRNLVHDYMWNEETGWYMDYNFETGEQSDVMSLAAFVIPLAGFDSQDGIEGSVEKKPSENLKKMVGNIKKFQLPYGLANTTGEEEETPGRVEQWRFPNVWSPRVGFVTKVVTEHPEFHEEAEEVIVRDMIAAAEFFAKYGTMPETTDGETGELGGRTIYPRSTAHEGFLWTDSVYAKHEQRLKAIYARRDSEATAPETEELVDIFQREDTATEPISA